MSCVIIAQFQSTYLTFIKTFCNNLSCHYNDHLYIKHGKCESGHPKKNLALPISFSCSETWRVLSTRAHQGGCRSIPPEKNYELEVSEKAFLSGNIIALLESLITILVLHILALRFNVFFCQTQFLELSILGCRTTHFPTRTAHLGKWMTPSVCEYLGIKGS